MASNQLRREAKAQLNLNKLRGEGASKSKGGEMSAASKEIIANIKDKDLSEKWLFTNEQQENTPSRRDNVTAEKELNYRQQAANLIQDMGQRLPVNQLTINTAIVYMHRFYMFHSFQAFSRFIMAPTALFLAAKVEEQPRKLEHVIKVCHSCLHADKPHLDVHSDAYLKQAQELVQNELIMLETLGFDISIDHPHTYVVKCTQLVKASKDLSQMAYFMATNSLHLTTFCLKYKPMVVSAMCIHLSCKWSNYEIPLSSTGKAYWTYMDPTITEAALEDIINEFLQILNQCPTRLRKLKNYKPSQRDGSGSSTPKSKESQTHKQSSSKGTSSESSSAPPQTAPPRPSMNPSELQKKHPSMTIAEYKHKREKEQQSKPTKETDKQLPGKPPPPHPGHRNPSYPTSRSGVPAKPGQPPTSRPPKAPPGTHVRPPGSGGSSQVHHVKQERPPQKPAGPDHQKRLEKMPPHAKPPHPHPGAHLPHKPRTKDTHPPPYAQRPSTSNSGSVKQEKVKIEGGVQSGGQGPNKSLAGEDDMKFMEMKLMEQMKAEKTSVTPVKQAEAPPVHHETKHATPQPNHHPKATSKEAKPRHSLPANLHLQDPGQPLSSSQETKLSLYEQYKKNPDALRHSLKKKMQTEQLNEEEKLLLHKLKKKDEERQKKKREHRKQKPHSKPEGANVSTDAADPLSPSSGPLTVRIKLPAAVRAEMSMGGATGGSPGSKVIGSSSGSGSEAPTSSPGHVSKHGRKRAHGHDGSGQADPTLAKLSRKSEGHHHHHQSHHGGHDKNRQRHSRPSSHHHQSKSHQSGGQKIDEALFQRALVDAVSMVQSGQGGPSTSERSAPTATLKQHGQNGDQHHPPKHEKRRSSSKRNKYSGFDPTAPISNTPPEDLFEAEEDSANHRPSQAADLSSPETGEIRDDDDNLSPFHDHVISRPTGQSKDRYPAQWRPNANNNNPPPSLHYHHIHPSNGSAPPPPSLTHSSRSGMYHQGDSYERLPPPPPLTVKPRTIDQR